MFMLKRKKTDVSNETMDNDEKKETVGTNVSEQSEETVNPEASEEPKETTENEQNEETGEAAESRKDEKPVKKDGKRKDEMISAFEAWLEDSEMSPEALESARDAVGMIADSLDNGEYDDVIFDLIAKGADYPRAVEVAGTAGEIRGRNARIDELKQVVTDDGVPHPGASGGSPLTGRTPSIFDLAREAF